jgi:thiol-disulfide isomerase/thioredoxin
MCALAACGTAGSTSRVGSRVQAPSVAAGFHSVSDGTVLHIEGSASSDFPAVRSGAAVTVVNLWAQWCGPCRKEAPILRAADAQLRGQGVQFVGVDTEDSQSQANSFARAHGWTWSQFYDENGLTLHSAHFAGLPDTLILGSGGRIEGYYKGPVTSLSAFVKTVSGLTRNG